MDTINGITDQRREWKGTLRVAWEVVDEWLALVPAGHHLPMPRPVLRAIAALALAWNWYDVASILLVAYPCYLRPVEMRDLQRQHLLLPSDFATDDSTIYVKIPSPKTRRFGARLQHARASEPVVCRWLETMLRGMPKEARLFGGTSADLDKRFAALVSHFGFSAKDGSGFTLASLRAGAATQAYRDGLPLVDIQWQGRWRAAKTLETYIQEVAAQSVFDGLAPKDRRNIHALSGALDAMLAASAATVALQSRQAR